MHVTYLHVRVHVRACVRASERGMPLCMLTSERDMQSCVLYSMRVDVRASETCIVHVFRTYVYMCVRASERGMQSCMLNERARHANVHVIRASETCNDACYTSERDMQLCMLYMLSYDSKTCYRWISNCHPFLWMSRFTTWSFLIKCPFTKV